MPPPLSRLDPLPPACLRRPPWCPRPQPLPSPPGLLSLPRLQTHKPHAIVVGASSPEARTLELDLQAILESILIDNPRFFTGAPRGLGGRLRQHADLVDGLMMID